MRSVLVVSNDHVGRSMAGPGIRSFELARRLAERFSVTLSIPFESDLAEQPFPVVVTPPSDEGALTALALRSDAVFAQRLPLATMLRLARTGITRVYDLYAPIPIELLASLAVEAGSGPDRELLVGEQLMTDTILRTGSSFVCASDVQRDYWLGRLDAVGRLDPRAYREDPSLASLVGVLPFGLPSTPPAPGPAIRGVVPGVGPDDRVIVWNGGIWNWFDPVTVIRAVGELAERRPDVRLVFVGLAHPNPTIVQRARADEAIGCARELGLLDRVVFFNEGWVPYDERGAYLLDADLGVSAHRTTYESRLAFRTRILDCIWAGLPVVVTEGDALADVVAREGLGITVPEADPEAWVSAIETLLDDDARRGAARASMAALRPSLEWDRLVETLVPLLERPGEPVALPRQRRRELHRLWLRARASYRHRGAAGFGRRVAWHARRAVRRRPPQAR